MTDLKTLQQELDDARREVRNLTVLAMSPRLSAKEAALVVTALSIGAGEGNRTLVISLEGIGPPSPYQPRSDKGALNDPFERKRLFPAVRTSGTEGPDYLLQRRRWVRR